MPLHPVRTTANSAAEHVADHNLYRAEFDAPTHTHSGTYAPVPGAWAAPTFVNSWVNFGGGFQVAQYRLNGDVVELRGLIKTGTTNTDAFTLPVGFRPPADLLLVALASGGEASIQVNTVGQVRPSNVDAGANVSGYVSLSGVRFSTV